ncbi:hypothetical protein [Microtetraspora malaysiensis]|uniref:Uncharacterized protein n=1 Tax=Microtetraspora malaysiensis TaxID=161358 RepID=A0ABW6SN12_9ACTN
MIRPRLDPAILLHLPVRIPPGSCEAMPPLDGCDVELAELHDQLWPGEEWASVVDCARLDRDPYGSLLEALAARPGGWRRLLSRPYLCECGAFHVGPFGRRPR